MPQTKKKPIPAPIIPEGKEQEPGEDIREMFRNRGKEAPGDPIPVEKAQAIREAVLSEGHTQKPKAAPPARPQKPAAKPAPVMPKAEAKPAAASLVPGETAKGDMIRRLKFALVVVLAFSVLSTLVWIAVQTGDMTERLASPVIFMCHAISIVSALIAWFKK